MPKFSNKAQPFLDAIANGVFMSTEIRDWLIKDTPVFADYKNANVLTDEQRDVRWWRKETIQPYWANYHCRLDSKCTCRIEGSKCLESDAIFFFRNPSNKRVLAVHLEFKHKGEAFAPGQPESYRLRAQCYLENRIERKEVNPHHDWVTVLFCGDDKRSDNRLKHFDRVITHAEAASIIPEYPSS